MRFKIGSQDCVASFGSSRVQIKINTIPTLQDGGIAPSRTLGEGEGITIAEQVDQAVYAWPKFVENGTDGQGLTLSGDLTDTRIGSMRIPAAFLTPYQSEADQTEYVDVLVSPYNGVDENDEENSVRVYFYLNGGARVEGVKRTLQNGNLDGIEVYSARVPSSLSQDVNEVRAVVMPTFGRPTILQCADMITPSPPTDLAPIAFEAKWRPGWRGVLLIKFVDYVLDNTISTINDAVADAGHSRVRCNASSQYPSDSPGTFADIVWHAGSTNVNDAVVQNLLGDPYAACPVVTGGVFYPSSSDSSIGATESLNNISIVARGSKFILEPDYFSGALSWRVRDNAFYRGLACQFNNCSFEVPKNTTYDGPASATALGAQINSDGFGSLLKAYDLGYTPELYSLEFLTGTGSTAYVTYHNCNAKYCCLSGDEHVNNVFLCPSPTKDDVLGRPILVVGCTAYGINKSLYPWGSIGSDQITYDFDWESYGNAADILNLPNSGVLTPDAALAGDGGQFFTALNNSADNDDLDLAINAGVWPDYLPFDSFNEAQFEAWYLSGGTYTDHYGLQYASWSKRWTASLGTHFDFLMLFGQRPGNVLSTKVRCYGDAMITQALYYSNVVVDAIAVWDWQVVENATLVYGVNYGAETRDGSLDYQNTPTTPRGNGSQFWGPGIILLDPITLLPKDNQRWRSFIDGDPASIRGFSYIGSENYLETESVRNKVYEYLGIIDDGTSRVQAENTANTDAWWVVNLSR